MRVSTSKSCTVCLVRPMLVCVASSLLGCETLRSFGPDVTDAGVGVGFVDSPGRRDAAVAPVASSTAGDVTLVGVADADAGASQTPTRPDAAASLDVAPHPSCSGPPVSLVPDASVEDTERTSETDEDGDATTTAYATTARATSAPAVSDAGDTLPGIPKCVLDVERVPCVLE